MDSTPSPAPTATASAPPSARGARLLGGSPGSRGHFAEADQDVFFEVATRLADGERPAQLGPAISRARIALANDDPDELEHVLIEVAAAAISTAARIRGSR